MDANEIKEVKLKLQTFKEYNTYIYVRTFSSNYNGYILSVHEDAFMFNDDQLPNPFPIRFDELKFPPVPSNKKGDEFNFGRRE